MNIMGLDEWEGFFRFRRGCEVMSLDIPGDKI